MTFAKLIVIIVTNYYNELKTTILIAFRLWINIIIYRGAQS